MTVRRISFVNYKGGVGKTSLVVNLAAALAQMGKRVLLVDLDAQSNASIWLMRLDRWNPLNERKAPSLYNIFAPGEARLADCVVKDVVQDKGGKVLIPGLDLIPTTFELIDIEHEYEAPPGEPPYLRFRQQLAEIEKSYDCILFDCPPNVLRAAQCGLFTSNEVVIPSNPDALSLIGFTLFTEKLHQFRERSASFRVAGMGPPPQIRAVVFNGIRPNVDYEVPKMRMQFRINQFKNRQRVARDIRIISTPVRDAMVVRRAVTLGLPVACLPQAQTDDSVVNDYKAIGEELLEMPAPTRSFDD